MITIIFQQLKINIICNFIKILLILKKRKLISLEKIFEENKLADFPLPSEVGLKC